MREFFDSTFTQSEQKVLLFIFVFFIFGSLLHLAGYEGKREVEQAQADSLSQMLATEVQLKIDIREASLRELTALPGIGDKRATDIIAYREEHGFNNVNELIKIRGIGEKTYQRIYPSLVVFGDSLLASSKPKSAKQKADKSKKANTKPQDTSPVNINTGTIEELSRLSGIGEVKAQAIIDYREQNGAFKSKEELINVPGIGLKTLEKNLDRIQL
ncbi:MAG TPA: helix-hairpin-helix domain-containing protein [Candidatus Cloacimonetes bacterium]|nr:helix-hairpin-helix domain-containing protein [Candidatus Cloacimonadota bacterium]